MKVQTRLSLFSSILFGVIFAIISLLIYALYYKNVENSITENLKKTSYITALFYLEEDELNKDEFAKVKAQFSEFVTNSNYQIYNETNRISYGSQELNISDKLLNEIRTKRNLVFSDESFFCYGIFYEDNQGDFVVVVREKREELSKQLNMLLWILLTSFIIAIVAIIILSYWIANIAYRPFRKVINQVNNISTNKLDVQIKSPNTKDELQDLIDTFNNLLTKISETFIIQKNFVRYVSHEFKTPLTAMLGNLEVFSLKDRNSTEYEELSKKMIQQIYQLENILNTLLVVSDLREDANTTAQTRVDELTWQIIDKITANYPKSKILANINIQPKDEQLLYIVKDSTQLLMALFNLVENAVKYSQGNEVEINLYKENETLHISITDKGIGIPTEQLKNISKPFYRADNTSLIQGSGIGLSIALRILEKNGIQYKIESKMNIGTSVLLIL